MKTYSYLIVFFVMISSGVFSQDKKPLKLAMAQMLVEGGEKQINLNRAVKRINEAALNGADLVLLPEAMDLGWTHSSAKNEASAIPLGSAFVQLARAAKKNKVYVCAGLIEKDGNKTYNSAVLINRSGVLILKHRKLNELDIAHDLYDQGDRINVCETEFGTMGLLICADATAKDHVLTRSMGYLGAGLLLMPSSWAVKPDHDNLSDPYGGMWINAFSAVAKEFKMSIAAVSNIGEITDGPWKNWKCIGNSMLIDNQGIPAEILPYGHAADTIVYCTVHLAERPGRGTTWYQYWQE